MMNMRCNWKLGLAAGVLALAGACADDGSTVPGTTTGNVGTTDPNLVGVGGSLAGVSATADTDLDGVPDVTEGTGDADLDGIPAHRDPDEVGGGNATNGNPTPTAGNPTPTNGNPTPTTGNTTSDGGVTTGGDNGATNGQTGCVDDPAIFGNECPGQVACGGGELSCGLATDSCCVTEYKVDAAMCLEGTTCAAGERTMCDGPEDCNSGEICCTAVNVAAGTASAKCVAEGQCTIFGQGSPLVFEMCHQDSDCSDSSKLCDETATFTWWGNCK